MAQELSECIESMAEISPLDDLILSSRVGEELFVLGDGFRTEPRQFRAHALRILPEIQHQSVFKEVAPLRIDALERDVIFKAFAVAFEDWPEDMRQREDGWTEIESESARLQSIQFPAHMRVLLQKSDLKAIARKHNGRGHAAQSGPDDDDMFCCRIGSHDARTSLMMMVWGLAPKGNEHSSNRGGPM